MRNSITFKVSGKNAIFTDPITKIGGEFCTYQVPTYEALRGIASAIYWKPTFVWVIDRVKIVKPIQLESKNIKALKLDYENELYRYTYLFDVEYIVEAHIEWDTSRPDLEQDRNENKHHNIAKRYLKRGGKRDIFLGKRECVAYVEPCEFDSVESCYKDCDAMSFGIMFHSFMYPAKKGDTKLYANLDNIVAKNGVIEFRRPDECELRREVKDMQFRNLATADDACDLEILAEGDI